MTTLFISHSSEDEAWAKEIHAALVERKYPEPFLSSHPRNGIPVGDKWEQTLWQRLRRSGGMIVLCTADWLASPWCVAEVMIARERGKRVFILAAADVSDERQTKGAEDGEPARRVPDFLNDTQMISLATMSKEEAHRQLWDRLASLNRESLPPPKRPYPGLEPFHESDAAVFFGRDDKIEEVLQVLKRRRGGNAKGFILVLGASGCGKSSVVRAGVLPRLRRAGNGGEKAWLVTSPFFGREGLAGLMDRIANAFDAAGQWVTTSSIRTRVIPSRSQTGEAEYDTRALDELARDALRVHRMKDAYLVIVVDQLEEVFDTEEGSDARAALRLLLDAGADQGNRIAVLATMRSDFLNAFQLFEGAAGSDEERFEKITVNPMPKARFAEVIERPADRFDLDLDAGLAERIKDETANNDALPLLAFTLEKLYETCKTERRLTLQAYDALGGVDASVKHVADAILKETGYAGLLPNDPRMRDLRRAFYRLAQVGKEEQFTRRIACWSQMPDACKPLLQRLVNQRLLVSDTDNGEKILSVAHEALFRVWDTLNGWLRDDHKALLLRSQIEDAAAEWQAENRAASRTWQEERIVDAVRRIEDSGVSLDDVKNRATVDAFLGPTKPKDLEALPRLTQVDDAAKGSGRYGEAWRLPLGHQARASVGDRLALLGDGRKGVGLREDGVPDIDWVPIGGGAVTIEIRADPKDANSEIINRLTRTVASFWMARYPVTIVQFRAFLDECYGEDGWHLPLGLLFSLPPSYPPPKHRARYGNCPADNVNWWDAQAFCHWRGARLNSEVRLPTEFEWQLAATGGDPARRYPWGADWDPAQEPWRANTLESDLGRSTAVGMYPAGASPADILDMVGTLWEWCQNAFDDPDNTRIPPILGDRRVLLEDQRVLRGGSWNDSQSNARCAFRFRRSPGNRNSDLGFRVVCSSPSSPTERW